MNKQNNLAIDASNFQYHEAMIYSAMIQNIFGVQTFSIALLKEALEFIERSFYLDYKILSKEFNLSECDEDISYTNDELKTAKKILIASEGSFQFLTSTRLKNLRAEEEKIIRLDQNVLNHSLYFESWETKIEFILDIFLEKSKRNSEIESFDKFSKQLHRLQNALSHKNIFTINDLSKYCEKYKNMPVEEARKKAILDIRDLGPKCLDILRQALKDFNFHIA